MKKSLIIILWLSLSVLYFIIGIENMDFVALRLNVWFQMTITAFVLAATGSILQILLQNPIADPWILGVTGASGLGTVVAGLLKLTPILFWRTSYSLVGAGLAILFLFIIAKRSSSFNMSRFVLIGIGLNTFCSSLIIFLQSIIAPNNFFTSLVRISGHFVSRSFIELIITLCALIMLVFYLLYRHKELSILSTGEELAASVGVSVYHIKKEAIIICAIALAIVVSIAGSIGFIGLATPHIIRVLFGEEDTLNPEVLIPISGILIVLAALIVKILPNGVFVPIGTAMSLIGAPIFLLILLRNQ